MTTSDERYNGWTNRETWAFNLHVNNDQGMYLSTLEHAQSLLTEDPELSDHSLGESVVEYWSELLEDYAQGGESLPEGLRMFKDEVGSWWRIDYAETGAAVRESLSNES